jgi:hypothetical protein
MAKGKRTHSMKTLCDYHSPADCFGKWKANNTSFKIRV